MRRALLLTVVAAAVAGIAVSAYLTVVHGNLSALVCSTSGLVNCERVLSSGYGSVLGTAVPTSATGIIWFAVSGGLAALRLRGDSPALARAQLAWGALGLLAVLYLVYVEIDRVGAICVWCTVAHALVLLTLLALLTLESGGAGRAPARR